MKKIVFLSGVIFMILALPVRAQVYEMHYQGFETGESPNYTVTPDAGAVYSTVVYSSGDRSIQLRQQKTAEVEYILDTLDFTQNTSLRYIALQFDHICHVAANSPSDMYMGMIYYKRANQSDAQWTPLSRQEYNQTGATYSVDFRSTGAFYMNSYNEWNDSNLVVNNTFWRSERFDLDEVMTSSLAPSERKLLIKFVLRRRTIGGQADTNKIGWWLDNVKVSASAERMVTPKITMVDYPHAGVYPHSRGARIVLDATTTVTAGINPDSVYLYYTVGSGDSAYRLDMTPVSGVANRFEARIPFEGYDTLMRFFCVARDATGNSNRVTYPTTDNSWVEYWYVRGVEQPGQQTMQFTGTANDKWFPFPALADHRSEWIYDSALMASAGYGPGAITSYKYTLAESIAAAQTRNRYVIEMCNVPANYARRTTSSTPFYTGYMHKVYDAALTVPAGGAGTEVTVQLQDTFYYAGKGLMMKVTYDHNADLPYANIKNISTPDTLKSIYTTFGEAIYNYNPFTSSKFNKSDYSVNHRPAFVFVQHANQPLLYDAGVSELVDPNYDVPMTERPGSLTVRLKNYGSLPFQAIRISYLIDDTIPGYYDWTGVLNGSDVLDMGQDTLVQIANNINIPAGFHTLKVWVEDTLTSSGHRYRDHEPYNDTAFSQFIVCDGHMSGVRNIGGSNPHFNDIEEFLFSLSRCGIDDSLIVRLAPGCYPPFTMPEVEGLSTEHYIVFESMDDERAVLYSDASCGQGSIVDLGAVSNVRFRGIDFVRRSGALTEMVTLAQTSVNCRFENCLFADSLDNPPASLRIERMINSGFADSMMVDSCTFVGGRIGVEVSGQASDIRSKGNAVRRSLFRDQNDNALNISNQTDVVVEDNEMYDVLSNSQYVLMMSECYGAVSIQRNKIYTSHGAGGLGVSNINGSPSQCALVANNMVVSRDDGTASQMFTAFNFIQGSYTDVVYNSVLLSAPTRNNIPAATFGGGVMNNCRFVNNIVVALDDLNYAFSYQPLNSTTNTVSNNVYYSNGVVLNRRATSMYATLDAWKQAVVEDSLSISVNPNFLNGGLVDLRTYNRFVKGAGVPITTVTTDFYGNQRDGATPCPGAFEFASLAYDFEPEALLSPEADNCNMPETVEMVLRLRNNGIQPYVYGEGDTLTLSYQINGGSVTTIDVAVGVPANDTISIATGEMMQMPPNGIYDSTYRFKVWLSYATDPNQTNDTNGFTVISRYHPAAPEDDTVQVAYASPAVITPTEGVDWWQVYNSASAPLRQSQIYWYEDSLSTEPFYTGNSYTTNSLREGRAYYIRQRRAMPIVRITQIEILQAATAAGLTSPMPYWMNNNRKAALQLTNIGDATAYLEGDTLMTVSPTASLNAKYYRFGNVKIEPGQSLVVQFVSSNTVTDTSLTIIDNALGSTNVSYNSNIAFIYRHNGVVEDAVPFNAVITQNTSNAVRWATQNVPDYVWNGSAIAFSNNVAGVVRTAFNGDAADWTLSTADRPMFLDQTDGTWVRYVDAGCEGDLAKISVELLAIPSAEIELNNIVLPASGCGLGDEDVTVTLRNYGSATVDTIEINYCAGADTVTELITSGLGSLDSLVYTFSTPIDLSFDTDSLVTVRVWVRAIDQDPLHANDSITGMVTSLYTPVAPDAIATRQVQYATRDTISFTPTQDGVIPIWYDYSLSPVDTGFTYVTDILYADGTMGMSLMVLLGQNGHIGDGVTVNNKSNYPSPYQPNNAYAKQQYIYSASELAAAGLTQGNIYSIGFFLDSIHNATNQVRDSIEFDDYYIALGLTTDTFFANTSAWKTPVEVVYERHPQTIYSRWNKSWVRHDLDTPFYWDGTSSLVVQIAHASAAAITSGVQTRYTTSSSKPNTVLYKAQNTNMTPSVLEYSAAGTRNGNRPNISFNEVVGCSGPISTFNVQLVGVPNVDAAMLPFEDSLTYNSCDSISIPVSIRNQGSTELTSLKFYYYLDTLGVDSTEYQVNLLGGAQDTFNLFRREILPGRHTVTAIVNVSGDSIHSNDTVSTDFIVRFCGGNYVIASNGTGDYVSFGEAVDTLNAVGIDSSVVFNVMNGVYTEQIHLANVYGATGANSISFIGVGDSVVLTDTASEQDNYIMWIEGVDNINLTNIRLISVPAKGTTNANKNRYYGHALVLQNANGVNLIGDTIRIDRAIAAGDAEANNIYAGIALMGDVSNLHVANSGIEGGFFAIKSFGPTYNYADITIEDNTITDFAREGINIRDVNNLHIRRNDIRSANSSNSRGLTAIYLAQTSGDFWVEKNKIYLIGEDNGAKRGIQLENVVGTILSPAYITNNMISTYGKNSTNLPNVKVGNDNKPASVGILIDSSSSYNNVLFNSVRIEGTTATNQNSLTLAFLCGNTTSNLQVKNNIFSNFSYGYAYYVSTVNNVTTSDNNAYYSLATSPLAWGTACQTLSTLQTKNGQDNQSVFDEPYFTGTDDLHLIMTNFVGKGSYNSDVTDDIDGKNREQVPGPTIGAHEQDRPTHDMALIRIFEPIVPANPGDVETDSVRVVASFYNNGRSNETNIRWYAYIDGHEGDTRSATRNLGSFTPSQMKRDTVMMPTVLGLIDTHIVRVVVVADNDTTLDNNELTTPVYLYPAFDLQTTKVDIVYPTTPNGCSMQNTQVKITLKNVGRKPLPAGAPVKIGYHTEIKTPANVVISTLPDTVEQYVTLPNLLPISVGSQASTVEFTFDSLANLYPTDTAVDIKVNIKGWCNYEYDIVPIGNGHNDTTAFVEKNSFYTPAAPVGIDAYLPYGTWGEVQAEQENSCTIRWYVDSTSSTYFFPGTSQISNTTANYNRSTLWNNTPQFFCDTTYFLRCYSSKNCPSDFSEVTVHINDRIPNDMAFEEILAPLGGRVYLENDTVRVRIANYGTSDQSSIPVTYQLKQVNTTLQTVTETITATVPAGQSYVYTFDSLLNIPTPTTAKAYTLTVWTDLPTDGTRRNDTIRGTYSFSSLAQTRYDNYSFSPTADGDTKFDITRVSWNGIDFDMPPLNRRTTNLAAYPNPEYPVLHVTRGTTDSIIIAVTPMDGEVQRFRCRASVFVDFNRSGTFDVDTTEANEHVIDGVPFYNDSLFSSVVTIPQCASLGYMRMRVFVKGYDPESKEGHVIDFLLFVDAEAPAKDIAFSQIVSPRSYLIRDAAPKQVSFRMLNRGTTPLTELDVHYYFSGEVMDSTSAGVYHWTGALQPGHSEVVTLPAHNFSYGVTQLTIWHELDGDADSTNNFLVHEYNRFHIVTLTLDDNFDSINYWYAPTGYNEYSRNYWQLGSPHKARIDTAYSGTSVWVTDLNNTIVSGKRGNVSYLYSPIIDISQIRADTVSFRLRRNLLNKSSLYLEYFNFEGKWVKLDDDSVFTWYNDEEERVFNGTTPNNVTYALYTMPGKNVSGNFPEQLQFRFVYTTPMGNNASASFGEGCAIDDFRVARARRPQDAGVIAITQPNFPKYGETLYPEVVVKNFGTDTLREFTLGYTHYGTYMPKRTIISGVAIPSDGVDTFAFEVPFTITSDYPDSFYVHAFTSLGSTDIYRDNDSCSRLFVMSPLDNDISAVSLQSPLDFVIAGDSTVAVTLRVRNFGASPIASATATYVLNNGTPVQEEIDFDALLGHPLPSMEYFNYTFQRRLRAAMGVMNIKAYVKSEQNDYIYNDTVSKRFEGITSVTDLAAASIILDTSSLNFVRVALVIDNRGARGANNFEVGYWIDNDTTTLVRETFWQPAPIAALSTGYYLFDSILPTRSAPYSFVNAYVHIANDNDPSNDTTGVFAEQYTDIEVTKVIVEENAANECRVFIEVRNIGNLALVDKQLRLRASINGNDLSFNVRQRVNPGEVIHFEFDRTIPKSPTRQYSGSGYTLDIPGDNNSANNQTSIVEVVNYMEGIPSVDAGALVLEQNYPNPFTGQTTIRYSIPNAATVRFFIVDATGHTILSDSATQQAGSHSRTLDLSQFPAGVYFYGILVDGQRQMRKMILK